MNAFFKWFWVIFGLAFLYFCYSYIELMAFAVFIPVLTAFFLNTPVTYLHEKGLPLIPIKWQLRTWGGPPYVIPTQWWKIKGVKVWPTTWECRRMGQITLPKASKWIRLKLPRIISTTVFVFGGPGVVIFILAWYIPEVLLKGSELANSLIPLLQDKVIPAIEEKVVEFVAMLNNMGFEVEADKLLSYLPSPAEGADILIGILQYTGTISRWATISFITLIFIWALTFQWSRVSNGFVHFLKLMTTTAANSTITNTLTDIAAKMHQWLIGQFAIIFILAITLSVLFEVIGIQMGWFWGLVTGIFCIIPVVGVWLGGTIAVMAAILNHGVADLVPYAWMIAAIAFCNLVEAKVIAPKVYGDALKVPIYTILVTIAIAHALAGLIGLFFAMPALIVILALLVAFEKDIKPKLDQT